MRILYMWIYWIHFEHAAAHQSWGLPLQKAALHFIDFFVLQFLHVRSGDLLVLPHVGALLKSHQA